MKLVIAGTVLALSLMFFKIRSSVRKFCAARNALLAKQTFATLDDAFKQNVVRQAEEIMQFGGIHNSRERLASVEDSVRYGFFALAMGELGIRPALPGEEWHHVRNPFVALLKADKEIWMAQNHMRNAHGIDMSL